MSAHPTSTTVLDSILFRDAFGTPRMREVFSDLELIRRYVEVEIALARAQARCGVIPADAAEAAATEPAERAGAIPPATRVAEPTWLVRYPSAWSCA